MGYRVLVHGFPLVLEGSSMSPSCHRTGAHPLAHTFPFNQGSCAFADIIHLYFLSFPWINGFYGYQKKKKKKFVNQKSNLPLII